MYMHVHLYTYISIYNISICAYIFIYRCSGAVVVLGGKYVYVYISIYMYISIHMYIYIPTCTYFDI